MTNHPSDTAATQMRSHLCGSLRASDAGSEVVLCGWVSRRREHGEHLAFIDLRDYSGLIQCVVDGAADLRSEYVVRVTGTVRLRPEDTANDSLPTGAVEVGDCTVEVLSEAEPPPFPLDSRSDVDENIRLRHRYLDLRRSQMQRNLRQRSAANAAIRQAMDEQGFVEIETPLLIASTPEGARDFVVPSRLHPGSFYALPQSPQLFKQLCMVGGIDRYYQLARCLRDEDLRADRQFEFTQLDAEMSFAAPEDVFAAITHAVRSVTTALSAHDVGEIPTMSWHDAMDRYGSDKPDTRFAMELIELTEVFSNTDFNAFKAPCVKGIVVPGGAELSRSRLDDLTDKAKRWGAKGLVWMRVRTDDAGSLTLESPVAKFLSEAEISSLIATSSACEGELLLLVADERRATQHVLGLLRLELGKASADPDVLNFCWVVDFPLFESVDVTTGHPTSAHHPFTMPHPDDLDVLETFVTHGVGDGADQASVDQVLSIRSQAYDLVLNGWELGSGSVRIHRSDVQSMVFGALGISPDEAQQKFGFLLDAFRYGAPPHAGFAFGVDRLVALLLDEDNIREVIAFPKTQSGADPLTSAPGPIDDHQLTELGLRVLPQATAEGA